MKGQKTPTLLIMVPFHMNSQTTSRHKLFLTMTTIIQVSLTLVNPQHVKTQVQIVRKYLSTAGTQTPTLVIVISPHMTPQNTPC